jgi:hypothetical protein
MSTSDEKSKIVRFNVGGTRYDVLRSTLECHNGSMLATLVSKQWKEGNSDETIFIDRSGRLFELVLNYLRSNEVHLPTTVNISALQKEFEFYGIDADMNQIHETNGKNMIHKLTNKIHRQEEHLHSLNVLKLAYQLSALVEHEAWKSKQSSVQVNVLSGEYVLLSGHENVLREQLLERGLELKSSSFGEWPSYVLVNKNRS